MHDRTVFFISDGTGITAESLGHLLGHFPDVHFRQIRIPFVDSEEKVDETIRRVNRVAEEDAVRPVVIATFIRVDWRSRLREAAAMHLDVFSLFVDPLSAELGHEPTGELGKSRGVSGSSYFARIDAINYTLNHDDGISASGLEQAQVILVGVSRCGKTPTCLYLAMQFGIKAANYPLTPEDFERHSLPAGLSPHRAKLFGLTIRPERAAFGTKRTPSRQPLCVPGQLPLGSAHGRGSHAKGEHTLAGFNGPLHRGNRHQHSAAHPDSGHGVVFVSRCGPTCCSLRLWVAAGAIGGCRPPS